MMNTAQNNVKESYAMQDWKRHGMDWKKPHRNHNVEILSLMLGVYVGVKSTLSAEAFSDRLSFQCKVLEIKLRVGYTMSTVGM